MKQKGDGKKRENSRKIEILAPAGSMEGLRAAVGAGADAVYMGGSKFGARAFADNPDTDGMLSAIDYAHFYGRSLYMTVNTLLKPEEMGDELYRYLKPYYEAGLDAVIVQDAGVAEFVSREFPGLPIHASTQMSLTAAEGARSFRNYPVTRIVPARELGLDELKRLRASTKLEIETFVHGALCYCYSGQCLMSSMLGGRSGNRGRCAQPCRMEYEVREAESTDSRSRKFGGRRQKTRQPRLSRPEYRAAEAKNGSGRETGDARTGCGIPDGSYILSPKDMCTLDMIPELIEAGIDSFKIEGRMKHPEYAAGVAAAYRAEADRYFALGAERYAAFHRDHPEVLRRELLDMQDLYNRGGFSNGYYRQHNGRAMMSMQRPNHSGVRAARVLEVRKNRAVLCASEELNAQDVLEIRLSVGGVYEFTLKDAKKRGEQFEANFLPGLRVKPGDLVFRTRNNHLLGGISERWCERRPVREIVGCLEAKVGEPLRFSVMPAGEERQGEEWPVTVSGDPVECAQKQPMTEERLRVQLEKTGDTPFRFAELKIRCGEPVFIPLAKLNELRREALCRLEQEICGRYRRERRPEEADSGRNGNRKTGDGSSCGESGGAGERIGDTAESRIGETEGPVAAGDAAESRIRETGGPVTAGTISVRPYLSASVLTGEQLAAVLAGGRVSRIYYDIAALPLSKLPAAADAAHAAGAELFVRLPQICRAEVLDWLERSREQLLADCVDGYLLRNYEELWLFGTAWREAVGGRQLVTDAMLYTMNREAKRFFAGAGAGCFTAPYELDMQELAQLGIRDMELTVYGRIPLMTSAQCVRANTAQCLRKVEHGNTAKRVREVGNASAAQCLRGGEHGKNTGASAAGNPGEQGAEQSRGSGLLLIDKKCREMPFRTFCRFCYSTIYSSECLWLADCEEELARLAPCGLRYDFTTESGRQTAEILSRGAVRPDGAYTRGHFFRGVQ